MKNFVLFTLAFVLVLGIAYLAWWGMLATVWWAFDISMPFKPSYIIGVWIVALILGTIFRSRR